MKIYLRDSIFLSITAMVLTFFQSPVFAQSISPSNENLSSEKILEKALPSVVLVLSGRGDGLLERFGSGVIIRSGGVILTAYHVVKDATQVQIRQDDNRQTQIAKGTEI